MQQTDAAVTALTDSAAYAGMSEEERQVAALAQLDELAVLQKCNGFFCI